jgi:uncharacterized protein YdeI (YjbR/CyaY-like superfamily)
MQQMANRSVAMKSATPVRFFSERAAWRRWLATNHARARDITLGLHKRHTNVSSLTYQDAVDEALCFGWIDGVRRRIDDDTWSIRFSPRKARSIWSAVNLKRFALLQREGRVAAAGLAMFAGRAQERTGLYSYENRPREFDAARQRAFRAAKAAWKFFESQPPSYRRAAIWWVLSAKQEATRDRRFAQLVADSTAGQRIAPMRPKQ